MSVRPRWLPWHVVTLLALGALVGCASKPAARAASPRSPTPAASPKEDTVTGTLDARGDCIAASKGYEIVVTDESNKIVATTRTERFPAAPANPNNLCDAVPLTLGVPQRDFYTLKIGQHEGPTLSRADLAKAGWRVRLVLNVDKCNFLTQNCDYLGTSPFYEQ